MPAGGWGAPRLCDVLANRRWWRRAEPFAHYTAADVFTPAFYQALETEFQAILKRGAFSKCMPNSDAFAWNFPPDVSGNLSIFYSREWHDLLATLTGVDATGDVN